MYKDSEIKRRKLAKEKKAMDLTRHISELKECTFTPKLSRRSPGFNKENVQDNFQTARRRSPQQFYEEQIRFQEAKARKLDHLKHLEEA